MEKCETPKSVVDALSLAKLNGWASVDELASWCGVHPSTVYEWLKGGAEPGVNAIAMIGRHSQDYRIQLALAQGFLAGTAVQCSVANVEACDSTSVAIVMRLIDALSEFSDFATKTKKAIADGDVSGVDLAQICHEGDEAIQLIESIKHAARKNAEAGQKKMIFPRTAG